MRNGSTTSRYSWKRVSWVTLRIKNNFSDWWDTTLQWVTQRNLFLLKNTSSKWRKAKRRFTTCLALPLRLLWAILSWNHSRILMFLSLSLATKSMRWSSNRSEHTKASHLSTLSQATRKFRKTSETRICTMTQTSETLCLRRTSPLSVSGSKNIANPSSEKWLFQSDWSQCLASYSDRCPQIWEQWCTWCNLNRRTQRKLPNS